MPELPEVEVTVELLKAKVRNRTFVCVWPKENNLASLKGRKVKEIGRKGKYIIFYLDDNKVLLVHLRMTGHFLFGNWKYKEGSWESKQKIMQDRKNSFLRFVFSLENGKQLALSDPRKFAKVLLINAKELDNYLGKLGPDALQLPKEGFFRMLKDKKGAIKPLLMNQHFIAGIGNIYAAEILFQTEVHPQKKANSLSKEEIEKIYRYMRRTLKKGISLKGDSTSDYRLITGEKGGYQNEHLVYDRKGLPCFRCDDKIERIKVGGRGTYYCPTCQKI